MKQTKWTTFSISLVLMACLSPSKVSAATAGFQPEASTDYVVRNVETGLFLRCSSDKVGSHAAYFGTMSEKNDESSYYLWQFNAVGEASWTLYNKGRQGSLTDEATSSTYRGETSATGATWYVASNPYNSNGYLISSNSKVATTPKHCLYAYKYGGTYYLCSTEEDKVNLGTHGATNYYQLPTFQFYTYKQLYSLAKNSGYTGNEATKPSASDWKELVEYVSSEHAVEDRNVANSATDTYRNYVLASRRYHRFLWIDNKGALHSADKITTSSVMFAQPTTGATREFMSSYHGDAVTLDLAYANNGHKNDYRLKNSKGQYLCVDNEGNVSYSDHSSDEELAKLDNEWVVVNSPYDDNLQYLNVSSTDIRNVENWYFRIENNGKRIKLIDPGEAKAEDNVGGFLTDVDKAALGQFDKVKLTTISRADIFSNSKDRCTAANIWHVTLAFAGKDEGNNQPIGIVSTFSHSLYYIQNVNSGKYIGNPTDKSHIMPLLDKTAKASDRALFYLVPKDKNNDNGVYALMLLDRSKSSTTEVPLGYLDIADTDDNGQPTSTEVPKLNQAALVYQTSDGTSMPNDAYNWSFHRARFIQARAVNSKTATGFYKDYRYVTLWFPFDVTISTPGVKLYMAKWVSDYSGIRFLSTNSLPANHGAMVLAPNTDDYKEIEFAINPATDYRSDIGDDILKGVAEGEDFVLSDDDKSPYYRKGIYVFSETNQDYSDRELALGYPCDKFLMANRCYIVATEQSKKQVAQGKTFSFSFDDETTGISNVSTEPTSTSRYYDLQGRPVSHPQHGIYITNGKKIMIR